MNKRQIIVLWIIAVVLVVALIAVNSSSKDGFQSATERNRGETLIKDLPAEEVAGLTITTGDESVTLKRQEGGWVVTDRDNYPADTPGINDLIRTVAEVEVTQGIEADPEFAPRFGMDPKAEDDAEKGTVLVMSNGGGEELAKLTFGRNLESGSSGSPFGGGSTGRFVLNHADDSGVYVTSELFPTLSADATSWLDDSFLKVEKVQSVAVSQPGQENEIEWKLTRPDEGADFSLEGKKPEENLDTSAVNPIKNLFSYARFEDVVPKAEADEAWDKEKRQTAVIETVEGFTYNLTFGPRKATEGEEASDSYLLRVTTTADIPKERKKEEGESEEDAKEKDEAFAKRKKELEEKLAEAKKLEGITYQVTKFTVDPLLKNRTGLIKSAPPAQPAQPQAGGPGVAPPMLQRPANQPAQPATPPRRKVQAVTPPIAIPPAPKPDEKPESETPEEEAPPAEDPSENEE